MLAEVQTRRYTYKDYERLEEGAPYQLIGGELIMTPSATPFHQEIIGNLSQRLRPFVQSKRLGKFMISPLDIQFSDTDVYQPDLVFIRQSKLSGVGRNKILTIPDLVIEVLSPSNAFYDLTRKKEIYCTHGVQEYWIIDPIEETIEIFVNDGGLYRTEKLLHKPALLESNMFPGFSMKVEEVFEF